VSADGVSLPTTLAQLGNVARTQAKAQQAAPQVTPFSGRKDADEEIQVSRVKETTESEKGRVTRQDEEKDKRKRRRLRRRARREAEDATAEKSPDGPGLKQDDEADQNEEEQLGALIDLRV
jgi:hypothetical protein